MCNRYWDVYECRWQDYDSQQTDDAAADAAADVVAVPQPRSESEAPAAAPASRVPTSA